MITRFPVLGLPLAALPLAFLNAGIAQADSFNCATAAQDLCTLNVAPDGGAGVAITAPGTQFEARVDGTGFEIHGNVTLGAASDPNAPVRAGGYVMYDAHLVAEYSDPARPEAGFRRLHGSAEMRRQVTGQAEPGFGMLELAGEESFRVDVGVELGSILRDELDIVHLNPDRPCEGLTVDEPGFRECPYWIFRVVDEKSIGASFGGTDVGANMTADASSSRNVTLLMDPKDFFIYAGYTAGDMDSVTLGIEPTAAEADEPEAIMNNDNGLGFSQHGYIPFSPRTTYGIEKVIDDLGLDFQGHIVIDKADIPLGQGVFMDGSAVFKLPLDELTGQATFDNHWQMAGNGSLKVKIPMYPGINWGMDIGEATAGASLTDEKMVVYLSGDVNQDFPWKPEGLPMSLDYRNNYQVAAVLVNKFDPGSTVPYVDMTDSFLQMEGEYLIDLSFGNPGAEFGREISSNGFFRADYDNGIEFWGSVGQGAEATMIHPLIQADGSASLSLQFDPMDSRRMAVEIAGEFAVGGDSFAQRAVLRVTPQDAYLGFPLSFDPTMILKAYNDIQDATRDAEAEVRKLDGKISQQRAIVQAERDKATAAVTAAQSQVSAAQTRVNGINRQIAVHESRIRSYKAKISSWYRWYKRKPWYKRAGAYATYLAKRSYYTGLIGAQYTAIGAQKALRATATGALTVAKLALTGAQTAVAKTPIDLDPRVAPLVATRDVSLALLNGLQSAMPEIPEIPGTIEATAGFRIEGGSLMSESRAMYCDNGSCTEIKGGTYDRKAGRACITLPGYDRRVCTAIPPEPI